MSEELSVKVTAVAYKYIDAVNVLYSTIIFYNTAIMHTLKEKPPELEHDYLELVKDLGSLYKDIKDNFYGNVVENHMRSMCFISLVSAFEEFLIEISMLALKKYPQKISGEQIDFKKAIEMNRDEMIEYKAKEYLNKIMYMSPKEYLKSLCALLSVDPLTLNDSFIKYIEIKSRRDLGVHNDWKKNDVYERKVKESKGRTPEDAEILRPSHKYLMYTHEVCKDLVGKITKQSCDNLFKVDFFEFPVKEIPELP